MTIKPFKRKDNYFNLTAKLKAEDIDTQFNNIVEYINNQIIPFINNLISQQFIGSDNPVLRDSFLVNIGDGDIKWDFLKDVNFLYNGLSLIKIEKGVDNSVLAVDNEKNYVYVTPEEDNQVLKSRLNDAPFFEKISNDCFEDRSISGKHIELYSISEDNLPSEVYNISDNSLNTVKFMNECVTLDNLEEGGVDTGLTIDKLTPKVAAVFSTMITSNMIPNGYISEHFNIIFGNVNSFSDLTKNEYKRISNYDTTAYPVSKLSGYTSRNVANYKLDNLALNSINGDRLHHYNSTTGKWFPDDNDLINDGAIHPEHLTPELRALLDL